MIQKTINFFQQAFTKDYLFFQELLKNQQQKVKMQENIKAQSTFNFWQRIMNDCVRRRYLKSIQIKQNQCKKKQNFEEFKQCFKRQDQNIQKYMYEMEFYHNKYQTCISEGLNAKYRISNVEKACGNKIMKYIRSHNDIL